MIEQFRRLLIRHEGLRLKPYRDTVGKLTIGVGRNLDDMGISEDEALYMLNNDIDRARLDLLNACPWVRKLDSVRQDVLLSMTFNMGITRLKGFVQMLANLEAGHVETAALDMLDSKWAKQVGKRATELAEMMKTGQYKPDGW